MGIWLCCARWLDTQQWVVDFTPYAARHRLLVIGFVDTYSLLLSLISGMICTVIFLSCPLSSAIRELTYWQGTGFRDQEGSGDAGFVLEIARGLGFVILAERV